MNKLSQTTGVASPCTNICSLNEQKICVGCYRSLEEIACWSGTNDLARQEILEKVVQRIKLATIQNLPGKK